MLPLNSNNVMLCSLLELLLYFFVLFLEIVVALF
jgi:hypothetical protein